MAFCLSACWEVSPFYLQKKRTHQRNRKQMDLLLLETTAAIMMNNNPQYGGHKQNHNQIRSCMMGNLCGRGQKTNYESFLISVGTIDAPSGAAGPRRESINQDQNVSTRACSR